MKISGPPGFDSKVGKCTPHEGSCGSLSLNVIEQALKLPDVLSMEWVLNLQTQILGGSKQDRVRERSGEPHLREGVSNQGPHDIVPFLERKRYRFHWIFNRFLDCGVKRLPGLIVG